MKHSGVRHDSQNPGNTVAKYSGVQAHDTNEEAPQLHATGKVAAAEEVEHRWWLPHVVLLCCQCAFAVMHISSHGALEHIPALPYSAMRVTLALPLLFAGARIKEPGYSPGWRALPWLIMLGILGVGIPQSLVFVGNHLAGAAYAPILVPTTPVYVALLSAAFGMEPFNRYRGAGIVMSVTGALILVHVENLDFQKASTLGLLALWMVVLSYACYLVMLQHVLSTRPYPFTIFAWASLCGDIGICAVAVPQMSQVDWASVPGSAWAAVVWAGVVASAGAHSAIAWAIGRCSAVLPSTYSTMQPLLTGALAAAVLGQVLTLRDMGAMALILAGLCVVIFDRYWRDGRGAADAGRGSYEAVGMEADDDDVELTTISVYSASGFSPADGEEPPDNVGLADGVRLADGASADTRHSASEQSSEADVSSLMADVRALHSTPAELPLSSPDLTPTVGNAPR